MEKSIYNLILNGQKMVIHDTKTFNWVFNVSCFAMAVTLPPLTRISSPVDHLNVPTTIKRRFNHAPSVTLAKVPSLPRSKLGMEAPLAVNHMSSLVLMPRLTRSKMLSGQSKLSKNSTSSWMFVLVAPMVAMDFSGGWNSTILKQGSPDQHNNSFNLKSSTLVPVHMFQLLQCNTTVM